MPSSAAWISCTAHTNDLEVAIAMGVCLLTAFWALAGWYRCERKLRNAEADLAWAWSEPVAESQNRDMPAPTNSGHKSHGETF